VITEAILSDRLPFDMPKIALLSSRFPP